MRKLCCVFILLSVLCGMTYPVYATDSQYIVVNFSPQATPINQSNFDDVIDKLPPVPESQKIVGIGGCFNPLEHTYQIIISRLQTFLSLSEETNIPIVVQLDVDNWWGGHPELWNWWDPSKPGYDPDNRDNVEWFSWDRDDAIKVSWRNWGRQLRVKPAPNKMSPAYRAACHTAYETYIPVVLNWWQNLPEEKKYLFVGFKVGWEASIGINSWYYPNGNYYFETWPNDESPDPTYGINANNPPAYGVQQIGYAALKTAGIKTSGSITEADLAEVIRRYMEDLCQKAMQLGLPREKLFTHVLALWKGSGLNELVAVNDYSCPGWSYYGSNLGGVRAAYPEVDSAINASDAPYWGTVEFLYQGAWTMSNWRKVLENSLDERAKYINIYNWDMIRENEGVLDAIRQVVQNSISESSDDVFDIRANSGLVIISSDPGHLSKPDPNNMFQADVFIYDDVDPVPGSYSTTFEIDNFVEVGEVGFAGLGSVLWEGSILIRATGGIILEADVSGSWVEILNETISLSSYIGRDTGNPYIPGGENELEDYSCYLRWYTSSIVSAKKFRVTFAHSSEGGMWAPWIDELDGYGYDPICGDPEHPYPAMDFNHDCYVDLVDFAMFAVDWLDCTDPGPPLYPAMDFNHDYYVDLVDFAMFAVDWLDCTDPGPPCNYNP